MKIQFTKMHGTGNDFVLINCMEQKCPSDKNVLAELSKRLCDRRFGIGADQFLLLSRSKKADFKMRIFNADGSEVEMCGNGIRCLAKYIWDRKLSRKTVLDIETLAGIIKPEKARNMVKVDMGEPIFEPESIPVKISPLNKGGSRVGIVDYPLKIADKTFRITCVSMGNPHAVIFIDDVLNFQVSKYGPLIETHPIFPKKTNVEFIEVLSAGEIRMRVWERGSGETLACGTGACASAAASHIRGFTNRKVKVHLLGGDLLVDWAENNRIYMTGPAVAVFEGAIDIDA